MKRGIFVIIGSLFLILNGSSYAYDNGDFQVWNTDDQEFKINERSKVTLQEEFYWGDNANELYYYHFEGGFVYSFNKHFDLGINYRQVYQKKKGKFKPENRPHLNATLKYEFYGFQLNDRSRMEYRHFDYQTDIWRYRNKFTLKFPWKLTRFKIQPYAAEEVFIVLNNTTFTKNRVYGGLGFTLTKNIKGEIYYMLESIKNYRDWYDINVLGTKLKFIF